jgi:hypothetical protein
VRALIGKQLTSLKFVKSFFPSRRVRSKSGKLAQEQQGLNKFIRDALRSGGTTTSNNRRDVTWRWRDDAKKKRQSDSWKSRLSPTLPTPQPNQKRNRRRLGERKRENNDAKTHKKRFGAFFTRLIVKYTEMKHRSQSSTVTSLGFTSYSFAPSTPFCLQSLKIKLY